MRGKKGKYLEEGSYKIVVTCSYCHSKLEVSEENIMFGYKYGGSGYWYDFPQKIVFCQFCKKHTGMGVIPGIVRDRILEKNNTALIIKCDGCKEKKYIKCSSLRPSAPCHYRYRCESCDKILLFTHFNLPKPVKNGLEKPKCCSLM